MSKEDTEGQLTSARQSILDAASKLIAQKGVKNTSLADISKEVGISKGTLYYYYSNKNDIIYDIADIHLKQITEELLSWIDNIEQNIAPEEILKVVFERISTAETRGKLHLYLISDAVTSNEPLKQRFREKYKEWRITLEDGLRKVLKNRTADYSVLSYIILAALDGFTIQWRLGVEKIPIDGIADIFSKVE
ncbi:TetR/AcrR family transcriptional regulator [Desulfosporosinus sp. BICA1-9]|uniref:TetR/AcrR family transcriptional regulator n=1 Tax=Desulfosporosinus sp. BICA1-9 TaxID=1531958 RepID=UPI00054C26AB|nr:TetR/AcrR family transcriptional regulator [Desulfosporosinus sp. BICA1-9]KJS47116.1 MAG: TetR family transcriptional regulator [Peptococcaceae bacterium BRH_c23]KJS79772.1 MAG: TetR family transcriptional regulator [Desulfosporosinus sp. BICA1-9]HBW39038.1 TetR/AcrR family transcriptional regulator [Desulfosporosinus sp.]